MARIDGNMTEERWRIGELAAATGVTVRALHHYDRLGLLSPPERSLAGHRLYGRAELERLYLIVALRELGLSLHDIHSFIESPGTRRAKLEDVVQRHLANLDRQLELLHLRKSRLQQLALALSGGAEPSVEDLRAILEASAMHEKYYTPEQLEELEKRRNELGEEGMQRAQQDWQDLIAEVEAEKTKGTDPSAPRMQELAGRWRALIEAFTGGDPEMFASLKKMYDEEGPDKASRGAVDPELMSYMGKALDSQA